MGKQYKSYTRVFKVFVLKFRYENRLSYRETVNHFNIANPSMIANW